MRVREKKEITDWSTRNNFSMIQNTLIKGLGRNGISVSINHNSYMKSCSQFGKVNRRPAKRCFRNYISKIKQSEKLSSPPPSQAASY